MKWPWSSKKKTREQSCDTDSHKAIQDSQRSLEETMRRWRRVNEVADRADHAHAQVRSQRDQNHLADIVRAVLGGTTS